MNDYLKKSLTSIGQLFSRKEELKPSFEYVQRPFFNTQHKVEPTLMDHFYLISELSAAGILDSKKMLSAISDYQASKEKNGNFGFGQDKMDSFVFKQIEFLTQGHFLDKTLGPEDKTLLNTLRAQFTISNPSSSLSMS